MFIKIDFSNVRVAAAIHSLSWRASHRSFCTPEFVALRDAVCQEAHLRNELIFGKRIWLLVESALLGLVSVDKDLIENLYVCPPHSVWAVVCGFCASRCRSA